MAAPVLESIDALLDGDPRALDDETLKQHVRSVMAAKARVDAAVLAAVSELDVRNVYVSDGQTEAKAWVAHHTAVGRTTAGALVWLTKRLRYLPAFEDALSRGTITYDHARVVATAINPRTMEAIVRDEAMLCGHAATLEADDFGLLVARWRLLNDPDGPDAGKEKPSEWHVSPMLDGRHRVDGELDLEDSVEYLAELEARYEEIWRADHAEHATAEERNRTTSQRYAAAQVEMARRSSMAGNPEEDDGTPVTIRTTARKTQIIVVADIEAVAGDATARAELEDGTPVPQDLLQRWLCDTALCRVVMIGGSVPYDLGKVTYTASDGQRRVLTARDRGCIVPGCKRKARWCQAHHVVPWPNGPTNIDNLVLLCHRHHKQVHRGIIRVVPGDRVGTFVVTRADGTPLYERPPPYVLVA